MVADSDHLVVQLIHAVEQSHSKGICHGEKGLSESHWKKILLAVIFHTFLFILRLGDIKCENVLVTSWNWLYLADFASFKPTFIPDDDPSDFSFYFDTGGRRRCYLAPEVSPLI
jgi:phosphoinositide-3-kinase regulatory subunit 4